MLSFLSQEKGTQGSVKTYYKDFQVEEILPSGEICSLEYLLDSPTDTPSLVLPPNPENLEYLHFQLEKYNTELNFAIKKITTFCNTSKKRIHYAGLKDKRGITCQLVSFYKPSEKIQNFRSKTLCLKKPYWSNIQIDLGSHIGNHFKVVIRDISLFPEKYPEEFPNYFGSQRFGGTRQITHIIGKEFLKGNYKDAVFLYLTQTNPKEEQEMQDARNNLKETLDYKKALKEMPKKHRFERAIISHLSNHPNDYIGAFRSLPKALCYLFTHAYQSHLFNEILSLRLQKYKNLEPIDGDTFINEKPAIPLFGYESKISDSEAGELEKEILEKEEISLENFHVKSYPELSSRGSHRTILEKVKNLQIQENKEEKILSLDFNLEKGTYATTYLREITKTEI